ncbi:MAG: hypothetical protein HYY78_01910 [Betaproteobacteria bacterium]|nr:hypothetical protein [Betaproteobacteria bacterium]
MNTLAPGTICFLRGLADYPDLTGRVVEVAHLVTLPDFGDDWYELYALWIVERFPGQMALAPRRCLLPITPPGPAATARKPVTVEGS